MNAYLVLKNIVVQWYHQRSVNKSYEWYVDVTVSYNLSRKLKLPELTSNTSVSPLVPM